MAYASTETGLKGVVTTQKDVRTIKTEVLYNQVFNIVQSVTTETTVYTGLNATDAANVNQSFQHKTTAAGDTTTTLGGIKVTVASGTASTWFSLFGVRGVQQTGTDAIEGDSHLHTVTLVKKTMTVACDNTSATVEDI